MSEHGDEHARKLAELEQKLRDARSGKPLPPVADNKFAAMALGWRMALEMVLGVGIGGVMGWFLDQWLGTVPLFLIVFCALGFAAGIRTAIKSAEGADRRAKQRRKG